MAVLRLLLILLLLLLSGSPGYAASVSYSLTASEPVTVDTTGGVPRLTLSLGGETRYATYSAGLSTATVLVFVYAIQAGDFAPAGVGVSAAVDLNGGTIRDLAGNLLVPAFTTAATPLVKVQTYTVAFTSAISSATATNAGITISKAPVGADFSYTITSAGGSGSVTGSGTIGASPHSVTGIDVSALPAGTLTASVTVSTAAGTGEARTATIVPSFTGVLDSLPTPGAAYSVRRLSGSYSGPLLRVRRSDNSQEQDFSGSTVGGGISAAALSAFCGSSTCTVRSWYDQSGNGRDGLQATASNQPVIANSGTPVTLNGKPAVGLGGKYLQTGAAAAWLNNTPYCVSAVGSTSAPGTFVGTAGVGTNLGLHIGWRSTSQYTVAQFNNDADFSAVLSSAAMVHTILKSSPGGSAVFLNGVSLGSNSLPSANLAASGPLNIGIGYNVGASWFTSMPELIVFTSVLSAGQRQALEANQGLFYGISVQ